MKMCKVQCEYQTVEKLVNDFELVRTMYRTFEKKIFKAVL